MNETAGKRLVILGGGESGIGAAVLGKVKGMDVFLSDCGKIAPRYLEALERYKINYEQGQHTSELILNADEVVKSPGVPPTAPMVQEIVKRGIPVISEIELAGRYSDAKMVCITGSNGKTTTTMLIYHILREAGINVGLAGNVGRSLAWQVAEDHHDVYVVELKGTKSAQRMILELKDKLKVENAIEEKSETKTEEISNVEAINEATQALQILGYNKAEIKRVFEKIQLKNASTEDIIKNALKNLAR